MPLTDHAALVADPDLRETLDGLARRRVPGADAGDIVQNVLAALLECADPPSSRDGILALAHRILRDKVADYYRHRGVVGRFEEAEGGEDVAAPLPADAWDPVDAGKRRQVVEAMVESGALSHADVDLLEHASHEGFVGAARERNTTAGALRVHAHRKRALLREGWAQYLAYASLIVMIVGAILWALLTDRAHGAHAPPTRPPPAGP
jgi:DNA-directed RNA polymerase specialized sigma24 family protein